MVLDKLLNGISKMHRTDDMDYQRRLRMITYAIVITAVFALFYVAISIIADFNMGIKIMSICFFALILAIIFLRLGVHLYLVAHYFALTATASIFGCIYFSGGLYSPVFPWLIQTPIVLLLIAGKKSGYMWILISLLLAILIAVLRYNDFEFPIDYNTGQESRF